MRTSTNLLLSCAAFLAADFVAWRLSFGKLYAIRAGRNPDLFACAEGSLACLGLFYGVDIASSLHGWKRWAFVALCGAVPVVARRLSI